MWGRATPKDDTRLTTRFSLYARVQNLRVLHPDATNASLPEDAPYRSESIHYVMIPEADMSIRDAKIEADVDFMITVINIGRVVRERKKIPIKMPVQSLLVVHPDANVLAALKDGPVREYVKQELHVYGDFVLETDDTKWCNLTALPNFAKLGQDPDFPKQKMRSISTALRKLDAAGVKALRDRGFFEVDGVTLHLKNDDVTIRLQFIGDKKVRVRSLPPFLSCARTPSRVISYP